MSRAILVLNAGSSSIKFQLYDEAGGALARRFKGRVEGIGTPHPRLLAWGAGDAPLDDVALDPAQVTEGEQAQAALGNWIAGHMGGLPAAIGHRVVHGGARFTGPVRVDAAVLAELEALVPLAPLHQPHNLAPIRSVLARRPELPQVACFDTAFHARMPELAQRFAIPEALHAAGVRRYGFHGLSYEYIAGRLPEVAPEIAGGRVVVAHLGSGASACALLAGRSVESTMGFTALDGLPMGTRPGQLDAGVVLYLAQQGRSPAEIEHILYHESGLLGLSGISADVRDLLASTEPRAALALAYFAYRTAQAIAALASAMGGLDGVVFTAGVGENAAPVRAMIAARCAWLGLALDPARNAAHGPRISAEGSLPVYVIPTNEERMVARHVLDVLETTA
ncbi:acetate/propionate family kinase [Roseomonas sp. GC11]|uniref:acetate/propionate family kinase n=1 Tax=Roseomonas sp. GC11 TaxID=2950546 RepID=UPI00210BD338|nr:acetate/propionate family kinase [Roseomonas sp. GC11]MCQ4159301.1 acetate/propionate family kinase [Roseomonas sp. GC11]